MDNTQLLKRAIDYAKQNPDSQEATQLRRRIESGMYNNDLKTLEINSPGTLSKGILSTIEKIDNDNMSFRDKVSKEQVAGFETAKKGVKYGADKFIEGTEEAKRSTSLLDKAKGELKAIGGLGTAALQTIRGGMRSVFAPVTTTISPVVEQALPLLKKANPELSAAIDQIAPKIQEFTEKNPVLADNLAAVTDIAVLLLGGNASKPILEGVSFKEGANVLKNDASKVLDTTIKTAEKVSNVKESVKNIFKGKPEAEVLSTPKEQVYKLNPNERKLWFENEQRKITTESEITSQKIKSELKTKADANQVISENLQKELSTASRDKVIELRPKIVKAMGEQSKVYRGLIDEEMAGKEAIPVKVDDLKTHIDTQYGDNPALATAIKDRLGLSEAPKILKKGELPTIQADASTKTLGDLYNKTKELKQEISSATKSGGKVFTAEDKLTDDAIHTLTDFMKKNGVDFSEANKFWSRYAPIRNQLVSEAKPFLQTGTQTKTFAGTLKRVSEGKDINNEIFIREVENLVKEPITKEAKTIVSKLNANQKLEIANKMEAETKLIENQMAKDKSLSKLSSSQFEIERQARLRSAFKKIVGAGLIAWGAKQLGITRFFGL